MVVLKEGGVAIDLAAEALAQDQFSMWDLEVGMEVSSGSALDAVIGPQCLSPIGDLDGGEGFCVRV